MEEKIAELEHGEKAKLVSSGVAAISGSMMAFLKSGDHVISCLLYTSHPSASHYFFQNITYLNQ